MKIRLGVKSLMIKSVGYDSEYENVLLSGLKEDELIYSQNRHLMDFRKLVR